MAGAYGGEVGGGWVSTAWTLPTAKEKKNLQRLRDCSGLLPLFTFEGFVLVSGERQNIQILFTAVLGGRAQRENELPPFLPAFLIPSGSVSMSGIYQDLPRWVRACPCSSQIALHNLRNVDERCLACPRWAREMDNVCYKCCTHTKHRAHTLLYLQCQMTLLSPWY